MKNPNRHLRTELCLFHTGLAKCLLHVPETEPRVILQRSWEETSFTSAQARSEGGTQRTPASCSSSSRVRGPLKPPQDHKFSLSATTVTANRSTAYSLRMMSIARGGLSVQLGSTVRFDPLFMLAADLHSYLSWPCSNTRRRASLLSKQSKERPQTLRRGIAASRAPRRTCCARWTRLFPAVIGQRVGSQITTSWVHDVKTRSVSCQYMRDYIHFKEGRKNLLLICCSFWSLETIWSLEAFCDHLCLSHFSWRSLRSNEEMRKRWIRRLILSKQMRSHCCLPLILFMSRLQ